MSEKEPNLYEKLAKIRKMTEVLQKNKQGFNYRYTSIDAILAKVTAGMEKYGVSLTPIMESGMTVIPETYTKVKQKQDKKTGETISLETPVHEYIVSGKMVYRWTDNSTGEHIDVPWFVVGSQEDPAQAQGSALTYGLRQFLTQYFQIATPEDDPDKWRSAQKSAEVEEDQKLAEKILDTLTTDITAYLGSHKDKTADVKKFMQGFLGNEDGDYYAIDDPALAQKLAEEYHKKFDEKK